MIESNNVYDTSAAVLYWIDFNNIIQRRITNDIRHVKSSSHVNFSGSFSLCSLGPFYILFFSLFVRNEELLEFIEF